MIEISKKNGFPFFFILLNHNNKNNKKMNNRFYLLNFNYKCLLTYFHYLKNKTSLRKKLI